MSLRCLFAQLFALAITSAAPAQDRPVYAPQGGAGFVLPVPKAGQAYYLVVGSPNPAASSVQVTVSTEATTLPEVVTPPPSDAVAAQWRETRAKQAKQLQRAGSTRFSFYPDPPAKAPETKHFHMLLREGGLDDPKNYRSVPAKLVALGKRCQVYLDAEERLTPTLEKTIAYLIHTFDTDVQPWANAHLGEADDIDRDGRFTIFLTERVRQIPGASASLQGFVRSSDFVRDVPAPFSNQCDMMVLRSDVAPGPHLVALLVHEYAHAIVFCEHYLHRRTTLPTLRDEESWLGEGLAHVAETIKAQSWSNLDYRINAYLCSPESYRLVVADYFGEKLWRNPGTRGSAYLFLRWCVEQKGSELLGHLVRSNYHGIENLEIAMQRPFGELFRAWTVAQVRTPFQPSGPGDFRPLLIGPYLHDVPLDKGTGKLTLAATAAGYFHLHADKPGNYAVRVATAPPIELQVTLVPVPEDRRHPRIETSRDAATGMMRWRTTPDWRWRRFDVSPRRPGDDARGDELVRTVDSDANAIQIPPAWRDSDVVLRFVGEDRQGRRVTSWARWKPAESSQ